MKMKAKKAKSFVAEEVDWAESSNDEENEERANLCLMGSTSGRSYSSTDSSRSSTSEVHSDPITDKERVQMILILKDEAQKKLEACLAEIKEFKLKNEEIGRFKHENSDLRGIIQILN